MAHKRTSKKLFAQIQGLCQEVNELCDTMQTNDSLLWAHMGCQFGILNHNVCCIAVAPAWPINRCVQGAEADEGEAEENAIHPFASMLSQMPRTLFDLWAEYQYGIGRQKPAKDFTAAERGKVKYLYHHQKVVWDIIARLMHAGFTAEVAIDRIYSVYGCHQSVTKIINDMRRDRQQGRHPNLCL